MKRNVPILTAGLLILAFLAAACTSPQGGAQQGGAAEEPLIATPSVPESTPVPEDALGEEDGLTARGYVLVSSATQTGWLPLPDEGETVYPLAQVFSDGTRTVNLIHLTPDGMYMEDSTCENHDCVEQGIVTLDNRYERILSNMIICLPNQVMLALYTPEEVLELLQGEGQ